MLEKKLKFEGELIQSNKITRNYSVFKNTLLVQDVQNKIETSIIIGNKNSKMEITAVISPFCSPCKEAWDVLSKLLESNKAKLRLIIKADFENYTEDKKSILRGIMSVYLIRTEKDFIESLTNWFKYKEKPQIENMMQSQIERIYNEMSKNCKKNNIYYTPAMFVNNRELPKIYSFSQIKYFIEDLVTDKDFLN